MTENRLTKEQLVQLEASFKKVSANGTAFAEAFYSRFLESYPRAQKVFAHTSMGRQAEMLSNALLMGIQSYLDPSTLDRYMGALGVRHERDHAIRPTDYVPFKKALMATFAEYLGDEWTDELKEAWSIAYDHMAQIMTGGHGQD